MLVMKTEYPEIGICGLSCRLCPNFNTVANSRCLGCKSKARMAVGCPFITCAIKKKKVEFCWECDENKTCEEWAKHRALGCKVDSFKCYQKLENDIALIKKIGVNEFEKTQIARELILKKMLTEFNEGRSKSYYCIAATVLEIEELKEVLIKAQDAAKGLEIKEKSKILHSMLDELALQKNYILKLRK